MAEESFLEIIPSDNLTKAFRNECNCLPACVSIEYNGKIDRLKLKWQSFLDDNGINSYSKLTVVFRNHQERERERDFYFANYFVKLLFLKRFQTATITSWEIDNAISNIE